MKKNNWVLKDVLMVSLISVLFAVLYLSAVYFAVFFASVLTPLGLAAFTYEIIYGVWFMAATFAAYIIRKPGVAIVSEMLAALIEVLMGNMYGPIVFVSGFIQGAGAEAGFAIFKHKRYDWLSMSMAALGSAILSFIWGFFRSGFFKLAPGLLVTMLIVRVISSLLFSAAGSKYLADGLAKAGVLRGYAIGQSDIINAEEMV